LVSIDWSSPAVLARLPARLRPAPASGESLGD
jgi:hypothetical protein